MAIEIEELSEEGQEKNQETKTDKKTSELIAAMQKQIDELVKNKNVPSNLDSAEVLKEIISELKAKPDNEKYGGENFYVKPDDIDHDDYLDEGVPFYSHQVLYVIVDDKRNGHSVRTPFGNTIVFQYQSTKRVKGGNETRVHNISVYVSHSKKEIKWLEEHKGYGSIFFKSHVAAMSTDARKASKLARIMTALQRYEVGRIISMAKQNGVEPSQDINMLRLVLANKQADEEIQKEDASNEIRVKNAIIEKEVIPLKQLS